MQIQKSKTADRNDRRKWIMSTGKSVSDEETAYHEAGHVVMAVLKNVAVHNVSIVPDDDGTLGRLTLPNAKLSRQVYLERPDGSFVRNPRASAPPRKTKKRIEAELFVLLAGCAALALHHSPPPLRSRKASCDVTDSAVRLLAQQGTAKRMNDEEMALELAEKLRGSTPIALFIPIMMVQAVQILAEPSNWRAVRSLARELIKSGELSARRAKEVVKKASADNG
jgi:hypothetical protein